MVVECQEEAAEGEGDSCQKSEEPLLPCLDAAVAAQLEEKRKRCLSDCCAVQSGLGALLTA